jgi:uncharacterized protein (DUF433 family)
MITTTLDQHIEISPGIASGRPHIAGHRISVQDIVIWHEWMGHGVDEIAAEYDLGISDIYAALAYYYDHRAEIEQSIRASEDFIKELRRKTPSKVLQKIYGD